jgi:hypothetical protein
MNCRIRQDGRASVVIPMSSGELELDLPIILDRPRSALDSLARTLGITSNTKESHERQDSAKMLDVVGVLHMRVAMLFHGFQSLGVQCA